MPQQPRLAHDCNPPSSSALLQRVSCHCNPSLCADCCAIAASEDAVYVWQFRNNYTRQLASESAAAQRVSAAASGPSAAAASAGSTAAAKLQREGREKVLHIDSPGNAQVRAGTTGCMAEQPLLAAYMPHICLPAVQVGCVTKPHCCACSRLRPVPW